MKLKVLHSVRVQYGLYWLKVTESGYDPICNRFLAIFTFADAYVGCLSRESKDSNWESDDGMYKILGEIIVELELEDVIREIVNILEDNPLAMSRLFLRKHESENTGKE